MRRARTIMVLLIFAALAAGAVSSSAQEKIAEEFTGKSAVKIDVVSGDVIVETVSGNQISVEVTWDVTPKDAFTPTISEQGKTVRLKEKWRGSRTSGQVTWKLFVPAKTEIDFQAASGDIMASGLQGKFEAQTASGDVELSDMKGDVEVRVASGDVDLTMIEGDIDVHTASGDIDAGNISGYVKMSCASGEIELDDAEGTFDLSCASGDVNGDELVLKGESEFSTASGDVSVTLEKTAEFDLLVSSASGDAVLDYNGNAVKGSFTMIAKKRNGRIISPFAFDNEEEYEAWDQIYMKKSFTRSGNSPEVTIKTATGKAVLKK